MSTFTLTCLLISILLSSPNAEATDERPLLRNYRGKEPIPDTLYQTYAKLIEAMQGGKEGEIRRYCLPHAIEITRDARPKERQEYGQDMNLPFLKSRFSKEIHDVRKAPGGCYLIRTQTSHLFFVETKDSGWKLYRYGDTPIK
jgi:hypothetical protein